MSEPRRDRYRNNQEHVPQVGDVVRFEEGGRLTPVLDVMACDGDMQVRVDWGSGPPKFFALISPASPAPEAEGVKTYAQRCEELIARRTAEANELAQLRTENAALKAQVEELRNSEADTLLQELSEVIADDGDIPLMRCTPDLPQRWTQLQADVNRLNEMLRKTGYGQGQIDAYVAQCEELEQLQARLREFEKAARLIESRHEWYPGTTGPLRQGIDMLRDLLAPSPCKVEQPASVISEAASGDV